MTIIGIYYVDTSSIVKSNEASRINFVNLVVRTSSDYEANTKSDVYSQSGKRSGVLMTNIIENNDESTSIKYINSFQSLYLDDGIITFNVSRKYAPDDVSQYDTIITKPTYVSGKYSEYRNNLEVHIEGIYREGKGLLLKYKLKTV